MVLDGWVDGWMNGQMDGWVDGWMDGWVDGWMGGRMDGWVGGRAGLQIAYSNKKQKTHSLIVRQNISITFFEFTI